MTRPPVVSVFGSGDIAPGQAAYAAAEQVGATLGELGYAVATGGYGGAMEAVSRGAKSTAARVIGVTCRIWSSPPNQFLDEVIATDDLYERLRTLIDLADGGYVVLPGVTGTLLELAGVWELQSKAITSPRPIVCVGDYWRGLTDLMAEARPASGERIALVATPAELAEHFPRR